MHLCNYRPRLRDERGLCRAATPRRTCALISACRSSTILRRPRGSDPIYILSTFLVSSHNSLRRIRSMPNIRLYSYCRLFQTKNQGLILDRAKRLAPSEFPPLVDQGCYLFRIEGFAVGRRPECLTPHEAGPRGTRGVRGEADQPIAARPSAARWAMLDPEQRSGEVRESFREVFPDHLCRQILRYVRDTHTAILQLLANDHRRVTTLTQVDPDPATLYPETISSTVVDVLCRKVHPGLPTPQVTVDVGDYHYPHRRPPRGETLRLR